MLFVPKTVRDSPVYFRPEVAVYHYSAYVSIKLVQTKIKAFQRGISYKTSHIFVYQKGVVFVKISISFLGNECYNFKNIISLVFK